MGELLEQEARESQRGSSRAVLARISRPLSAGLTRRQTLALASSRSCPSVKVSRMITAPSWAVHEVLDTQRSNTHDASVCRAPDGPLPVPQHSTDMPSHCCFCPHRVSRAAVEAAGGPWSRAAGGKVLPAPLVTTATMSQPSILL